MTKIVKATTKIAMLVLISIATMGLSARAQSLQSKLKADIPFDFSVAGKKFVAGQYSIVRANQTSGDLILAISGSDQLTKIFPAMISLERLTAREKGSLVFHRYGNEYFLAEVWPAGSTTGRAFVKSRQEREAEQRQRIAANEQRAPIDVTVTVVP
jgi:hypothetical protein